MVVAKMSVNDNDIKMMDCYKNFLNMGFSEEDSKTLSTLAINSAISYGGILDIEEASSSLIRAMNSFDTKELND